ncbi:serine/threonine-protein phosphatase 6 regulatory ankyrin repeat subunit A isoform X1 [Bombus huntii]|uniref:serine/threonine-protein phosphatase 6 regulatory ankyrin repeat subunit A isoform X1 n=1 Tax=Bombus huntii TaxID=85661 RepID=UPI0021A9C68B|nr:serine/threonine-protein phosphatase 6 regulatory ankyrin repeat subunit A isoform X1 [Bombus huntii]XP_050477995.1 serine/threonine-protein phosphatase 6 regulatory ankyrin repeat subunit A isoform X1 [Bombus huntii]XP_050477996.1 serine/threonine-protein phosphatase 6 regulatory ankyrin repeat subunit A isoform X1 [Bombus huntii]XP_050477997.1 serine/threonine-protein phosphatase 6 regulatory ankyrin repeat subunit A isoform X1 [Bombus huntii]
MSSNSKKTSGGKDEKKNPSSKEESPVSKDETGGSASTGSTGGGTSADGTQPGSKPGSAGATSREAAQKLLGLAARGEWAPVDQLLKSLEKAVQSVGEDGPLLPLASIMDPATGMTPLMYAVKDNRTGLLDRMIELGADVGARNSDNYNALHIAAMYSREDVVKLLLSKRGVDPYATGGPRQQTAVHLVASRQTGTATSILRALLAAAGRDIRLKVDGRGKIPLLLAVEAGNQSMCRELLAQQAPDQLRATTTTGDSALHLAARRRDIDMVRILVDYGATVDMQNGDGQTALHIASAEGDETLVKYFYGVRASASITDHQDRTPMHLAAENGHASIIELLADKFKASIFERTKDGSTLMHIASLNGHSECATMLFKKGVYLHMPNKRGARSIHTAAKYGHVGIISTLLQRGEKVDATTNDNYTALHIAVENAKPAVVETLLGYGAEVHVRGGKLRETPLHIAARVPDGDRCALMLLKSGAGPNLTTDDGQTPVHVAASHGNLTTLLLLLEDGGDPMYKSKNGETPLHLACRGCKADVVRHLIEFVKERKGPETATAYVNSLTNEGASALHYAAQIEPSEVEIPGDDRAVIRALLEGGADVSLQTKQAQESAFHHCALAGNNEVLTEMISGMSATEVQKALNRQSAVGWTPLLIAAHRGHMELVTTLLANHARVDVFDLEGRSALHLAAEHGYLQVCDALLANKAFINSKSRVGRTALHLAAMNGYSHLVKFLVQDHGAAIDVLTLRKQTPLHLAAGAGQLEVCKLLLELGASIDATDDQGQKPIHAAAMNNYAEVAQLFLQRHPSLVMACTKDGNTCAHIAAMQGSVRVIEELMKFDRQGVISARNKLTEATPLQLAAEGGHAEVVKALVRAGASCADENRAGFTAVHLAAQHGHGQVLEVMRSSQSLRISSKKLGVTALHVAAYFGQADTVRELLTNVPGTVKSDPPTGGSLVGELGSESGMTPLHLAAYSGNENVVRLLLNSAGVQVEAATTENGFNPLHLACFGGHITVVGLLLSRSAELLHSSDRYGKTGLHIAATHGHYQMVEVLLGQGAEINATDKNGWTPLHCAARAGYLDVVKLLVESGASPKSETNLGSAPIWFAASEGHNDVLKYLMEKEHDTYALMEDKRFVYNMMVCSKSHNNKPIEEFVLVSPAPVDTAAKLSNIYMKLSEKEKERAKDLIAAGKQCEAMATELLALAAGADSAGRILTSMDRRNVEFLDVLIENEQKEVIAHTVVQRYLQELWQGSLNWNAFRTILLFVAFLICPPVWVVFALPLGHKYNNVPIIKFMSYLTSHIYLMVFLLLVGIIPIYPVVRPSLLPYWYEWCLLVMLSGLLLFELTNPSDKSGLGWIKLAVLLFGICGVAFHLMGFVLVQRQYWPTLLYLRNQLFALSFLLACVQILDFLSFHHLFGPWAIIIGNLMKDLARFLAVLAIFVFGFSMHFVALNQAFKNQSTQDMREDKKKKGAFYDDLLANVTEWMMETPSTAPPRRHLRYKTKPPECCDDSSRNIRMSPVLAVELLFFAIFGQTTHEQFKVEKTQPEWTKVLFKLTFGIYMLVSVVVLINLLIAMMSDTYQRIQAQSDIEWKYGLSKLVRNMHRTSTAPSPLNLLTTWMAYLYKLCKKRAAKKQRPSLVRLMGLQRTDALSARSRMGAKWLSKVKKAQVAHKDSVALSVVHLSPLGSQLSFSNVVRIDNVVDWEAVRHKYRDLYGENIEKHVEESKESTDHESLPTVLESSLAGVPVAGSQTTLTSIP